MLTQHRKTNTKEIIGAAGVREILEKIAEAGYSTQTVCIGGINESNLQRIVFQCLAAKKSLDGVAIVSAIMAAHDPEAAARKLLGLVRDPPPFVVDIGDKESAAADADSMVTSAPSVIKMVHDTTPLSHNMTNIVGLHDLNFTPGPFTHIDRSCKTLRPTSPWPWARRPSWLATEKKPPICASLGVPWSSTWARSTRTGWRTT